MGKLRPIIAMGICSFVLGSAESAAAERTTLAERYAAYLSENGHTINDGQCQKYTGETTSQFVIACYQKRKNNVEVLSLYYSSSGLEFFDVGLDDSINRILSYNQNTMTRRLDILRKNRKAINKYYREFMEYAINYFEIP